MSAVTIRSGQEFRQDSQMETGYEPREQESILRGFAGTNNNFGELDLHLVARLAIAAFAILGIVSPTLSAQSYAL